MEVESAPETFMDDLYENTEERVGSAVAALKNSVIGSQRQKNNIIEQGVLARLIHILVDPEMSSRVKTDVVYILRSIINGSDSNLKSLNDIDLVSTLLHGLSSQVTNHIKYGNCLTNYYCQDSRLVSACLCCLQSMLLPKTPLFTDHEEEPVVPAQCQVVFTQPGVVQHLVTLLEQVNTRFSFKHF